MSFRLRALVEADMLTQRFGPVLVLNVTTKMEKLELEKQNIVDA